jgi:type II secretory pathway component PulC
VIAHAKKRLRAREGVPRGLIERWRLAVLGLLCAAIAAQAAQIAWSLWSISRAPAAAPRADASAISARRTPLEVGGLVAAHLFGKGADAAEAEPPATAVEGWILSGTLQGETPTSGAAILGRTPTTTRLCAAGQQLAGGFTLAEVFADRVTLERAGVRSSLRLPRWLRAQGAGAPIRLAAAASAEERHGDLEPVGIHRRADNQPLALLELRPNLHTGASGHFDGMRVWGTGDGHNLEAYGLRRNDVIRAVGGESITNAEAKRRALDTLSKGQPVSVTVERNGALFQVQLGFSDPES